MIAPPGDHLDYGEGTRASEGERLLPGAIEAFKKAYAEDPHRTTEVIKGLMFYDLSEPEARVFFTRGKNKVLILGIKPAGFKYSDKELKELGPMVARALKRGEK